MTYGQLLIAQNFTFYNTITIFGPSVVIILVPISSLFFLCVLCYLLHRTR